MDPFTMVAAGLLLTSGVAQAMSNNDAIDAQVASNKFNADQAALNKTLSLQKSVEDARRFEVQGRKTKGSIRAAAGASGITQEGSAMDVLEESAQHIELDRLSILWAGKVQSAQYALQEKYYKHAGNAADSQRFLSAAGSLLSGGGQAAGVLALA